MASPSPVLDTLTEADRVLRWRLAELEKAGYEPPAAFELAERSDVDLHFAVSLARSGCPTSIALRILL